MNPERVREIIEQGEDCNRELKRAQSNFDKTHDLPDYCAALCNERGGYLLLGVENDGTVCGTTAFTGTHATLANDLFQKIGKRVNVYEVMLDNKRVLVFDCPSRNPGEIVKSSGSYHQPMRLGESLVEMNDDTARSIIGETLDDFSSLRSEATIQDIDSEALDKFVSVVAQKRGIDISAIDSTQLLKDFRLVNNRKLSNAGLLLIGAAESIDAYLPQAEIILEYRQNKESINFEFRKSWRQPLMLALDEIWSEINVRNIRIPFQEGLFQKEIQAFDEKSIREAILNAVIHRDYRITTESVFIRISADDFEITSPGGFLPGITSQNILNESAWRNRVLAETLEKVSYVERSGQGLDDIFLQSIQSGKGKPTIEEIERRKVRLVIPAMVQDVKFIRFLETVANEKQITFSLRELLDLELIRSEGSVQNPAHKDKLLDYGVIERIGRGNGTRYILSRHYYAAAGQRGIHTRLVGISRAARKQLILEHISSHGRVYNHELQDAFPDMKMTSISTLLGELRQENKICHAGGRKYGWWEANHE